MHNSTRWVVLKFGGSSVSDRKNWDCICEIVKKRVEQGYQVCIVHSALTGISDRLQKLIEASSQEEADKILADVERRHIKLGELLELDAEAILRENFIDLKRLSRQMISTGEAKYAMQAGILAQGELMATRLGAAFLNQKRIETNWADVRRLLYSKSQKLISDKRAFLNAECDYEPDEMLEKNLANSKRVVLTQGFTASNSEGKTVLLGRGGSDASAAYLGAKLQAERIEIWSDVPGMFSANPREISSARLLKDLTYSEAQEIATNGSPVLHPKAIAPAQKYQIPIHLGCTTRPDLEGTKITASVPEEQGSVKTIALRKDIILVSMESVLMWQKVGFLADAFGIFKKYGLSVDFISTSESNVTASLDPITNSHFNDIKEDLTTDLSQHCEVKIIENVSAISLLGRHIRTILHQLSNFFEVFSEHNIYMVDQAVSDLNFTFVVDSSGAEDLVKELHDKLILNSVNQNVLGPSWINLMGFKKQKNKSEWWRKKRPQLLKIAKETGAVYVYSSDELRENIERIQSLEAISSCFYAMKANANKHVLKEFYKAGLGFECVSQDEIERIFELFPEIDSKRILFTPNFAPRREYEQSLKRNVNLTVDNIYPLQNWPELFENQEIFLRIDPGYGMGHHQYVKTGGNKSKFGIPRSKMEEAKRIVEKTGAKVIGLHTHTGSGIKNEMQWKETAETLYQIAQEFKDVKILDLGGGFGVQQFDMQEKLNVAAINRSLLDFKNKHPKYELWIEPGRFLTATSGVLLAAVTQLKKKGDIRYIGVETGMNSFIRAALYGAYHPIVNLSKLDKPATQTTTIVGPICESSDTLGAGRNFPETEEGDIILIANTGAYGHVMSSNYNLRKPAEEVFI